MLYVNLWKQKKKRITIERVCFFFSLISFVFFCVCVLRNAYSRLYSSNFVFFLCSCNKLIIQLSGFFFAWWTLSNCQFFFLVLFFFFSVVLWFLFQCPWHMKSWFSFCKQKEREREPETMMGKFSTWEMIYVLFCFVFLKSKFYWKYNIQDQRDLEFLNIKIVINGSTKQQKQTNLFEGEN